MEVKLAPYTLVIRAGSDRTIKPTFKFQPGDDLTGWQVQCYVALNYGKVVYDVTGALEVDPLTPNEGTVAVTLDKTVTQQFRIGKEQHYFFRLIDTTGHGDIYMHGPIDAYVVAGAR